MGQILACTRRKQLDKFAGEEPKSPKSPIAPPARETIYIAYVVLLVVALPQLCLSVTLGSWDLLVAERRRFVPWLIFMRLGRSWPDSSSSTWRRDPTFAKVPA